jgi:Zn-dependent protease with chaperone function
MKRIAPGLSMLLLALPGVVHAAPPAAEVKLDGYAEWRQGPGLVVDGQRLRMAEDGRFHGEGEARSLASTPLGYEVHARGRRLADGSVLASEVEVGPNGSAMFERQVREATDEAETEYRRAGLYFVRSRGRIKPIGRLHTSGPEVERVREVALRLVPPYMDPGQIRVYVIENKEWNAFAMGNFSIYVFTGLLQDLDDDELAIVLGHELVHASHEHTRRQFKKQMWIQLAALGASAATGEIDDGKKRALVQLAATFSVLAWTNGYGRDLEDQADRVGARYAYEAGYDVSRGPALWQRFARKYGDKSAVASFFFANHSRSSARAASLQRELALNYPEGVKPDAPRFARRPAPGRDRATASSRGTTSPAADTGTLGSKDRPPGVSAAAPGGRARAIKTGMTPQDVRALLGAPREEVVFGNRTRWTYPDGAVVFEDGRVREIRF